MKSYSTKGLYNKYNKNHKEREKTDYYATPTIEVINFLEKLNIDFNNCHILEPCAGGGHMLEGILTYLEENLYDDTTIEATDMYEHNKIKEEFTKLIKVGPEYDFLSDNYIPSKEVDWVIMNHPYSLLEPFIIRSLEIAKQGVIMLGRLQTLEGEKRYLNIFKDNPPNDIYIYVDRISCWKNGIPPTESSVQAYAWFFWRTNYPYIPKETRVHWMRRADKI